MAGLAAVPAPLHNAASTNCLRLRATTDVRRAPYLEVARPREEAMPTLVDTAVGWPPDRAAESRASWLLGALLGHAPCAAASASSAVCAGTAPASGHAATGPHAPDCAAELWASWPLGRVRAGLGSPRRDCASAEPRRRRAARGLATGPRRRPPQSQCSLPKREEDEDWEEKKKMIGRSGCGEVERG